VHVYKQVAGARAEAAQEYEATAEAATQHSASLQQQVEELQNDLMQARASGRDAEVDVNAVRAEKKAALASVEKAKQELTQYQEQVQDLESRLLAAEAQKKELEESMNAASGGNDQAQTRISDLQDQLSAAKTEAEEASVALKKKAKEKVQAAQQETAVLEAQVKSIFCLNPRPNPKRLVVLRAGFSILSTFRVGSRRPYLRFCGLDLALITVCSFFDFFS